MNDAEKLISLIQTTAKQEIASNTSDMERINYGTITQDYSNGTYDVLMAGSDTSCTGLVNRSIENIVVGDNVLVKSKGGNIGNGYIAYKLGKSITYKMWTDLDVEGILTVVGQSNFTGKASFGEMIASKLQGITAVIGDSFTLGGKTFLDLTYPVGAIYQSMNSTSPATLFGGTWTQLSGSFLYPSTGASNQTGGESTVTLTTSQIPSHVHKVDYKNISKTGTTTGVRSGPYSYDSSGTTSVSTSSVGGGAAHNNMPPYTTIHAWYRVS